ncbi:GDP-mannose 4,6-dehydratase [Candidatus Nanopelagicales bacterium]|nr:GDP-mannose 4,6-dehydratase [Candidatus Nanopelagicales bacterium]
MLGSNSFSGSHFVRTLVERGHIVLAMSRSPEVSIAFRPYSWSPAPIQPQFLQIDLNDIQSVARALHDFRPNIVVNFASQSMVSQSWDFPEDWYVTNVVGLAGLARVLEGLSDLEKYVHATTPEVYGSTGGWVAEGWAFNPSTPYAISRAAGDLHLRALFDTRGLPVCFTRAANVFGPGQQLYRIVPRTLLNARLGKHLRLDGGGRSTRSFIHIDDVAEATYLIAQSGVPGETYHISTEEIVSIRELVERACTLTGVSFSELVIEGPERPGKDDTYMLDSTHLREQLGWAPSISLDEGMRDTLTWIDDNLAVLANTPDSYVHKR